MRYMGSKNRVFPEFSFFILKNRKKNQYYVEPFCGGCNSINKVTGFRIANDSNKYLIAMWKKLVYEDWIPEMIDKEQYQDIRKNKDKYPDYLVGWAGFNCSFKGKWFRGFTGLVQTKVGYRNYQAEQFNNMIKQVPNLKGVEFQNVSYEKLAIPENSIVYCDPPYQDTSGYYDDFDPAVFWDWVRKISKDHKVLVSEYQAPNDFKAIWSSPYKSSLSLNGQHGRIIHSQEKLFVYKGV